MFPDDYAMIRRHQEDLLQQAKNARLIRAIKREQQGNQMLHRKWASWFGILLVNWGQKLEHFGAMKEAKLSPSVPEQC